MNDSDASHDSDDPRAAVRHALEHDLTVDITTTGRRSGQRRRIEIWLLGIDGRLFITGTPGTCDWLANLRADPNLVVHLKQAVHADVPAIATEVSDPQQRRHVLSVGLSEWYRSQAELDELVARAPMVELHVATDPAISEPHAPSEGATGSQMPMATSFGGLRPRRWPGPRPLRRRGARQGPPVRAAACTSGCRHR
jgi:hypothetical protein